MTTGAASLAPPGALNGVLRPTLTLLALTAALWTLHVAGRTLSTAALTIAWAATAAVLGIALYRRGRIRRAAFLTAYFHRGSVLERRLRGGWPMAVWSMLIGALIAPLLLVALFRLDGFGWAVLVAAVPALVLSDRALRRTLAGHASEAYLPELAWRCAAALVGTAMVGALLAIAFYRAYPDLGAATLEQAVWDLVDRERARSGAAETLLQLAAAKDGLRLWLAQQLMPRPGGSLGQALGWLAVLAEEVLFVWSYLLLCSGVLLGATRRDDSIGKAS
jgi:hypothetical protein